MQTNYQPTMTMLVALSPFKYDPQLFSRVQMTERELRDLRSRIPTQYAPTHPANPCHVTKPSKYA
jgi:hypothetical protein